MLKRVIIDGRRISEVKGKNICYVDGFYTIYDLDSLTVDETTYYNNNSNHTSYSMDEWDAYYILKHIYDYNDDSLINYAFPVSNIFEILLNEIEKDDREEITIDLSEYEEI